MTAGANAHTPDGHLLHLLSTKPVRQREAPSINRETASFLGGHLAILSGPSQRPCSDSVR